MSRALEEESLLIKSTLFYLVGNCCVFDNMMDNYNDNNY